jgi:environmental stress-induced protein Ves
MGCAFRSSIDAVVSPVTQTAVTKVAATVLTCRDYVVMPWKDGGGTTREIARSPPADSTNAALPAYRSRQHPANGNLARPSFAWRVSIAEIAASCAFSRFEGYDRTLVLLRGARMTLHVGHDPAIDLDQYSQCAFKGEAPVRCTLSDGPVQDLNVMVARDRASAITEILRPGIEMQHYATRGTSLLLHCRDGATVIRLDDGRTFDLDDGETLRVDADTPPFARFSIAAVRATAPAVISMNLIEGERALADSVAVET